MELINDTHVSRNLKVVSTIASGAGPNPGQGKKLPLIRRKTAQVASFFYVFEKIRQAQDDGDSITMA